MRREGCFFRIALAVIITCFVILPQFSYSQIATTGDYRSRATGQWTTATTWQIRDALGNWTTATLPPSATNNVYIQGGHTVTLSSTGVSCNNLHIYYNPIGTRGTLAMTTNVLNINGKIRSYHGTVVTSGADGTFYSGQGGNSTIPENLITTNGAGKIKFVGNTRALTDLNAWGTYGTGFAVEFALNAGQTGTLNTGFKAYDVLFSSGYINSQTNRIGADGGSSGTGNMTINSGATFETGADIYRAGTDKANSLTVNAGGTLVLTADVPRVSFTTATLDPASTVNYASAISPKYFMTFPYAGTIITTYGNVILSGSGNMNLNRSGVVVKGNFDITGSTVLFQNNNPFSIEGNWTSYGPSAYDPSTNGDTIRFAGNGAQQITSPGGIGFKYVAKTGTGTLTQNNNVTFSQINGYLGIENGTWDAGTNTLIGSMPSSKLALNNNTQLILGNTGAALPQFAGPASSMTFNANSTLTLNGNGAQQLKGGIDYKNLTFDNSTITTLVSNPNSIIGTVTVKNNATLDIGNSNGFGDGNTNLTMTGGRFRMSGSTGSKPDIDGAYSLTSGVVEFYGSNVTRQNIKGKTAAGATIINYYNIEANGTNVGIGLYNIVITSNPLCSFTVKSGATYTMSDMTITGTASPTSTCKLNIETGGLFNCGNNQGFHGFLQTGLNSSSVNSTISASSITLSAGSTVAYIKDGDQPITNTKEYQNLIIAGNSGTKTAPAGSLIVDGDFTKTGNSAFAHNNGVVEMKNNGAAQNYYCTSAVPVTFSTLYNKNNGAGFGLNIRNDMNIETKLAFQSNAKLYLYDGNITMKSSATKTANVGQVLGSSSVIDYPGTGRFIIERYIDLGPSGSHGKSWQFLAIPVNGGGTINQAWQEGNAPMVAGTSGLGTLISNNLSGTGFDIVGGVGPSMKYYVPATNTWKGITRTDTAIYNAKGYMLFVRGDRSVSSYSAPATTTTLRNRGKIFTIGAVSNLPPTIPVSAGLFEAVGNPYASAIDFSKLSRTNIQAVYYVWDPKLGTELGAYQTFTETFSGSNLYAVTPGGGSYGISGSINNNIESGQAFFVRAPGPAGTLTFSENSKVEASQNVFRTANPQANLVAIRGQLVSLAGGETLTDGLKIEFANNFSNEPDELDAVKILNGGENFGVKVQNRILAVERRSMPVLGDTIWLNLTNLHAQNYQINLIASQYHNLGMKALLLDRFLHGTTALTDADTLKYNFTVNASQPGSYATNRFCLVFRKEKKVFRVQDLSTHLINSTISLRWQAENEPANAVYHVQASADGVRFNDIPANIKRTNGELFADGIIPESSVMHYRVIGKSEMEMAKSEVREVSTPAAITIFSNPVRDDFAQILLKGFERGVYQLELNDASGSPVVQQQINIYQPEQLQKVRVKGLAAGIYFLKLVGKSSSEIARMLIVR